MKEFQQIIQGIHQSSIDCCSALPLSPDLLLLLLLEFSQPSWPMDQMAPKTTLDPNSLPWFHPGLSRPLIHFCYLVSKSSSGLSPFPMFPTIGLVARNNIPSVMGELLKPVSVTISASAKPTCLNKARKSFPGMAPPSHLNQLSTLIFVSSGSSPTRT